MRAAGIECSSWRNLTDVTGCKLGLEMAGYQVDVADDGEAGLIVAGARPPDAAIIDLSVPIIDGWSLAESLRYVFGDHIRLIAVTRSGRPRRARAQPRRGIRYVPGQARIAQPAHQTLRQLRAH